MKKVTKKGIIGILAFALIGVSAFIVGTNAKYTNTITGNGEVEVAKWNFTVNDETEKIATINLLDTYDEETLDNGKIAPGTSGKFDLVIDASGTETGVKYTVDFGNETNKPSNLKFKYNNQTLDNIDDYEEYFTGIINANDSVKTKTLTVEWVWEYETSNENSIEENDKIDTSDGLNALNYSFDVTVCGTQVIPNKGN